MTQLKALKRGREEYKHALKDLREKRYQNDCSGGSDYYDKQLKIAIDCFVKRIKEYDVAIKKLKTK